MSENSVHSHGNEVCRSAPWLQRSSAIGIEVGMTKRGREPEDPSVGMNDVNKSGIRWRQMSLSPLVHVKRIRCIESRYPADLLRELIKLLSYDEHQQQ